MLKSCKNKYHSTGSVIRLTGGCCIAEVLIFDVSCTCSRILYFMATDFTEKHRWVASLEAAVKHLQKGDSVKRSVSIGYNVYLGQIIQKQLFDRSSIVTFH